MLDLSTCETPYFPVFLNRTPRHLMNPYVFKIIWDLYEKGLKQEKKWGKKKKRFVNHPLQSARHSLAIQMGMGIFFDPKTPSRVGDRRMCCA